MKNYHGTNKSKGWEKICIIIGHCYKLFLIKGIRPPGLPKAPCNT